MAAGLLTAAGLPTNLTLGTPTPRALCYNISNTERNSNENIPDVG